MLFPSLMSGEVSEWPKEHAWKACVGVTPPRVRIPPSPPVRPFGSPAWSPGPVHRRPPNRVRPGREQHLGGAGECRRFPGLHGGLLSSRSSGALLARWPRALSHTRSWSGRIDRWSCRRARDRSSAQAAQHQGSRPRHPRRCLDRQHGAFDPARTDASARGSRGARPACTSHQLLAVGADIPAISAPSRRLPVRAAGWLSHPGRLRVQRAGSGNLWPASPAGLQDGGSET